MSFVLDRSVALSWCFQDEVTAGSVDMLTLAKTQPPVVPALWHIEMSNVLGIAARKGRLSSEELEFAVNAFAAPPLTDHPSSPTGLSVSLPLMRRFNLTAHDATYLELALQRNLPLATLDKELLAAARQAGVALVGQSL
ncbi:MAG TPA: type II toxin-antitoxin system VapC family toxin [Granulicella sp.]|nr:type II toxin-antitoxin system VapC family toxin [Granulicella sp.]